MASPSHKLALRFARARLDHHYVTVGDLLFQFRRVSSIDMLHQGLPSLEGAAAISEAHASATKAVTEQRLKLMDESLPEDEAARRRAALDAKQDAIDDKRLQALFDTEQKQAIQIGRADAYLCAMITGMGDVRDGMQRDKITLLSPNALPEYAVDLDAPPEGEERDPTIPPRYIEPITFVQSETQNDPAQGKIWIEALETLARLALGKTLSTVQRDASLLATMFRRASKLGAGAGQVGEEVQGPTVRDPPEPARGPVDRSDGPVDRRAEPAGTAEEGQERDARRDRGRPELTQGDPWQPAN